MMEDIEIGHFVADSSIYNQKFKWIDLYPKLINYGGSTPKTGL